MSACVCVTLFIYLFSLGLFNDAINSSVSCDRMSSD
jgi:hypothetical protein